MTQRMLLEPSPLPLPARLGQVLGKCRLERIVATGGMGIVVEATHLQLQQRVAIKFMSPLQASEAIGVRRFLQEARAAARIRSEHVVRIFDVEMLPTGTPYIVMEFLEGEDLHVMLKRRGSLLPTEAVDYVLQACEAVAEAHRLGIVHRDLKPANLFHCKRADKLPFIKVVDFGLSKLLPTAQVGSLGPASTGPLAVMGTPQYASPEQLYCPTEVDVRTDIWALGVILYELIAGKPPFRAETFFELRSKIAGAAPQPLHEQRPEVTEALGAVVAKCLAKDPGARYATVADLADALATHAPRSSMLSVQRVGNVLRTMRGFRPTLRSATKRMVTTPVAPSVVSAQRSATRRHARRWVMLGSVAGGIIAVGLVAAWVASAPASRRSAPTSPSAAVFIAEPRSVRVEAPFVPSEEPAAQEPIPPVPSVPSTSAATAPARVAPATRLPPPRPRPTRSTEGFGGLL
jgi:serine/threonine-protein kinase